MIRILLFLCLIGTVISCEKTEVSGIDNSGLNVFGSQKNLDLISLVVHPEGGFIVGANSRARVDQQILIRKYSDNMNLEWQRSVGGSLDDKLFKIHIDNEKRILVSGLSYGFGNDTFTLSEHKFWHPYLHLLDGSGVTIWENSPNVSGGAGQGSGILERNSDILEDEDGRFVLGGELFSGSYVKSIIHRVIKSNGAQVEPNYTFDDNNRGKVEALFDNSTSYAVFNYWQEHGDTLPRMRMFQINKARTIGTNAQYLIRSTPWPWGNTYENENVGVFKQTLDGGNVFALNYILPNEIHQFRYDLTTKEITQSPIPSSFNNLNYSTVCLNGNLLFSDATGSVYETDKLFEVVNSFKTNWEIKQIQKLVRGGYVLIGQKENKLYLIRLNSQGEIIGNE